MIKCVAIDDEPIALSIIQEYCKRFGGISLRCFTSPIEGMACVKETMPHVVFLDIELHTHSGIDLARSMPSGTCIIFVTAYAHYALEGFNVDAVDFLHKPVFYPRFAHAMEKALAFLSRQGAATRGETITLKSGYQSIVVGVGEISHIEAMDNYVKVFRNGLPTVISQIPLKDIMELLPASRFVRVHRSFAVALSSIERYSGRLIYLKGSKHPVPVGRTYAPALRLFAE